MYRLTDPCQISKPPAIKPLTPAIPIAIAPLKPTDRTPAPKTPNPHPGKSAPTDEDQDRRNAVSDASTGEPVEDNTGTSSGFVSFPAFESWAESERRMSLHPDGEEEIIAEMRRNRGKERVRQGEGDE